VVFITAFADDTAREQALRAGALAFLQKPFEEQLLLDAVNQACRFSS
jgi:FixJ family two-component response regulator